MESTVTKIAVQSTSHDVVNEEVNAAVTGDSIVGTHDEIGDYVKDEEQLNRLNVVLNQQYVALEQSAQSAASHMLQGNRVFYGHLVDLMLFWHAAKDTDFIAELIKRKANKTYKKKVTHGVNFAPLIDVVWNGVNGPDLPTNKSNRISRALNRLYDVFVTTYGSDAGRRADLIEFMVDAGGVSGMVEYKPDSSGTEDDMPDVKSDKASVLEAYRLSEGHAEHAYADSVAYFREKQGMPSVQFPCDVVANEHDVSLVLVSKAPGGSFTIIDSFVDGDAIKRSLARRYLSDYEVVPPALRFVVETLATQCCPAEHAGTYVRLLNEASRVVDPSGRKALRRLAYRHRRNDFLLSNVQGVGGLVTRATPKIAVLESPTDDIALSSISRRALEKYVVSTKSFRLVEVDHQRDIAVIPLSGDRDITHCTSLRVPTAEGNDSTEKIALHFHRESTNRSRFTQMDVVDNETSQPQWHRVVKPAWFRSFNAAFTDNWVCSHARHINRPHQSVIEVQFWRSAFKVNFFNLEGQNDLTTEVEVPTGAMSSCGRRSFLSKDFAIAMLQLADLPIVGDVQIVLYPSFLKISYETAVGSYSVYLPCVTGTGDTLDRNGFAAYELESCLVEDEDFVDAMSASEGEQE
jgi:hypothetical protein